MPAMKAVRIRHWLKRGMDEGRPEHGLDTAPARTHRCIDQEREAGGQGQGRSDWGDG